jgi:hypothetical protein
MTSGSIPRRHRRIGVGLVFLKGLAYHSGAVDLLSSSEELERTRGEAMDQPHAVLAGFDPAVTEEPFTLGRPRFRSRAVRPAPCWQHAGLAPSTA